MNVKKLVGIRAREKLKIGEARMENLLNRKEEEKNRKREGVKKMRVKRKRGGEEQMLMAASAANTNTCEEQERSHKTPKRLNEWNFSRQQQSHLGDDLRGRLQHIYTSSPPPPPGTRRPQELLERSTDGARSCQVTRNIFTCLRPTRLCPTG